MAGHLAKVSSDFDEVLAATLELIKKGGGGGVVIPDAGNAAPLADGEAVRLRAEHRAAQQEATKAEKEWEDKIKNAEEGQKVASEAFARTRKDMEVMPPPSLFSPPTCKFSCNIPPLPLSSLPPRGAATPPLPISPTLARNGPTSPVISSRIPPLAPVNDLENSTVVREIPP